MKEPSTAVRTFGMELCEALGLNPSDVTRMEFTFDGGSAYYGVVQATLVVADGMTDTLKEIVRHYKFEPIAGPEEVYP